MDTKKKQVQKPCLFYILSTNKNTYIRHFRSIAVVQVLHFAHSHGEKQKTGLHISLQASSRAITFLANCTSNTPHNWQKKNLPDICSLPFHAQTVYLSWMMILFYVFIYLMQKFIEAHPVFAAKAWMEKWKLKKKNAHTHTKMKEMNFWVPTSPMYFTWYNFDGKCIRVVHPVDIIFGGLWYNGRKALWWNIQITEERQSFLMCKYGYLPDKVRTNYSQNSINSSKVKRMLLQKESKLY